MLRPLSFAPGATILREGEPGGSMFIVETGAAAAVVKGDVVMRYSVGD